MINDSFEFSCNSIKNSALAVLTSLFSSFSADDESETSPHDFEGNNLDLELDIDGMSHFKSHHSFTQMQVRRSEELKVLRNSNVLSASLITRFILQKRRPKGTIAVERKCLEIMGRLDPFRSARCTFLN